MKFHIMSLCALFALAGFALAGEEDVAPAAPAGAANLSPEQIKSRASYAIGMNIGRNFKNDLADQNLVLAEDLDMETVVLGFREVLAGQKPKLSDEDFQAALQAFDSVMQKKTADRQRAAGDQNKTEGSAYLEKNKTNPGVKTLPSGLQYKVIASGDGASPKEDDVVTTHYEGTLIDGTVFDSSRRRGEPAEFPVNRVIPGWTEALQKMKVGDRWQLFIPSDLAYGERGAGGVIGPNATLIFDIELLDIAERVEQ